MNASDDSRNCDSAQDATEHEHRTGRLEPEIWPEHVDPSLDMAAFDAPTPGRMGYAIFCDDGVHPDIAPYRLTQEGWL